MSQAMLPVTTVDLRLQANLRFYELQLCRAQDPERRFRAWQILEGLNEFIAMRAPKRNAKVN